MTATPIQATGMPQQQQQQQGYPMNPQQQYPAGYAYPPQMYHAPMVVPAKSEELGFCAQFGIRLGVTLLIIFIIALIRIFILGF